MAFGKAHAALHESRGQGRPRADRGRRRGTSRPRKRSIATRSTHSRKATGRVAARLRRVHADPRAPSTEPVRCDVEDVLPAMRQAVLGARRSGEPELDEGLEDISGLMPGSRSTLEEPRAFVARADGIRAPRRRLNSSARALSRRARTTGYGGTNGRSHTGRSGRRREARTRRLASAALFGLPQPRSIRRNARVTALTWRVA